MTRRRRLLLCVALVAAVLWLGWRGVRASVGSPRSELEDAARRAEATRVLARDGRVLGERPSPAGLRGRFVTLEEISPRLVKATIASEDKSFFRHDGVDRLAMLRALFGNIRHGRIVSGGSTITAQLVKRLDHPGRPAPRTFARKLVETARAQNLEAEIDKRAILEAYFAQLDYGRGLVGPEAASRAYFGVPARELSLAQAALLAVLPRAPSALDPYRHLERATLRQKALLRAMYARGDIDEGELARALAEPIVLQPRRAAPLLAPHVVLAAQSARTTESTIRTTLDFDLQRDVEAITRAHAPRLRERGAGSVAVVVLDASGEVLAEVGSADYFDRRSKGAVDLVRAKRQAGSTLKPFVYARAFERGLSPMAVLPDVPTELGTTGAVYAPDNFDGTFSGPISAREALAGSLNVPAVRLATEIGAKDVVETLRRTGLSLTGGAARFGVSIALGSGEVTPLELAEAYLVLARGGEHVAVRDRALSGETAVPSDVLDKAAVALVSDALSDPLARVRGLHARGPFELELPVALKTGTSTGFRDAWTAGYTRERVVVVWAGNADGTPTDRLTGAMGAGPVFTEVMRRAMRDVVVRAPLVDPSFVESAEVCPLSGERASEPCGEHVTRLFPRGHVPEGTCKMHRHARPRAARAGEPPVSCDPGGSTTVVVLPPAFARFLDERPLGAPGSDAHGTPWYLASRVPGCEETSSAEPSRVVLEKPRHGAVVRTGGDHPEADVVEVVASTSGLPRGMPLDVVVDGVVKATLGEARRAHVPISRGDHDLEVRPRDPAVVARIARASISVR